jgi:hypothetical protein
MAVEKRTVFDDEAFLNHLIILLCRDIRGLKRCAHYLKTDDFKPLEGDPNGRSRWIIADRALEYYTKYGQAIGNLLTADVISHAKRLALGEQVREELIGYATWILKTKPRSPDEIIDKVVQYKHEIRTAQSLQEMVELHSAGQLTDDQWLQITHRTLEAQTDGEASEYFSELESRIHRRGYKQAHFRVPYFLIEPLDSLVRGLGPGNLGMLLAPYKRGKGLMFVHMAEAFCLQRFNTLFITLEDPRNEVEDRLDAAISNLPIKQLPDLPNRLRSRFDQLHRLIHSRLRIVDRTENGASVSEIERILLRERDRGFITQALIVDYDDEITPEKKQTERRLEFTDIYRSLRRLAARYQIIVWTASQTRAETSHLKIIDGDKSAEDKSKIRKVGMAISMGQGEWGPDSIFLWVAAHKYDIMKVGCHIVPDKSRMLIYDREKTRIAAIRAQEQEEDLEV